MFIAWHERSSIPFLTSHAIDHDISSCTVEPMSSGKNRMNSLDYFGLQPVFLTDLHPMMIGAGWLKNNACCFTADSNPTLQKDCAAS
jgi:hypothetical protein